MTTKIIGALFVFFMSVFSFGAIAQTDVRVVVVPMFGDDAAAKWLGDWEADTEYKEGDIVEFAGSSYISLTDHTADISNIPPFDTLWDLVAAQGYRGPIGLRGFPGKQGIQGPQGDQGIHCV